MVRAGYSDFTFEDFVEETIALLEECSKWLPLQNNLAMLFEKFNRVEKSIIQHFRVGLSSRASNV